MRLRREGRDCLKLGCSLNPPQGASCAAETKTKMQRFNIYCKLRYACLRGIKASHVETISTFFESTDHQNQGIDIKSFYSKMTHRLEKVICLIILLLSLDFLASASGGSRKSRKGQMHGGAIISYKLSLKPTIIT